MATPTHKTTKAGLLVDLTTGAEKEIKDFTLTNHGHGKQNMVLVEFTDGTKKRLSRKWIDERERAFGPGAVSRSESTRAAGRTAPKRTEKKGKKPAAAASTDRYGKTIMLLEEEMAQMQRRVQLLEELIKGLRKFQEEDAR